MKLQVAIDRVSLEQATAYAQLLNGKIDILELGTSLVKDYGNTAIETIREVLTETQLLVDSKTIDEGEYEFTQIFKNGGDFATVMGAASLDTLRICYQTAESFQKTMMIDLLEVTDDKVADIKDFDDAIYALHHSVDRQDLQDPVATVADFRRKFPDIKHLAVAGGIDLTAATKLAEQNIVETIIVGSTITKADDILAVATEFMEVIHK